MLPSVRHRGYTLITGWQKRGNVMSIENMSVSEFARNYIPINDEYDMVSADGVWMYDEAGQPYLDMLAGYSATNFGHGQEDLVRAAKDQLDTGLTLGPRVVQTKVGRLFAQELGALTGYEMVLPSNGGVEAVESAIKTAHKWGEDVKGVPSEQSNIIVMKNNFHGRTTTVISFSDDPSAKKGFGPFTPGYRHAPFDDVEAVEAAIDDNTVAVLFEPIQGEGGVRIPKPGYLRDMRELCTRKDVLMIADEIQSGFGRTGKNFAVDHEDVKPDIMIIGKALSGGIVASSAILANRDILNVMEPGVHGSTYGGNPLAAAVGRVTVEMIKSGRYENNIRNRGNQLMHGLEQLIGHGVTEVRGKGMFIGFDIDPKLMTGDEMAKRLFARSVLSKAAHGQTLRFTPAFVIMPDEVDHAISEVRGILSTAGKRK
jgi:ornithine--oxo-acid transaminase